MTAATPGQADIPLAELEAAAAAIMIVQNANDDEPERFEAMTLARAALGAARAIAAQDARPAPGVWTVSECVERIGVLAGALHEIKGAYTPGTMAHDTAHAVLDQSGNPHEPPQPADSAISAWIENNPREFAAWVDAQRRVGGPAPGLAAARDASDLEVASVIAERNQLRTALQWLADDGNLEARDRLAAIRPELTRAASRPAPEFLAPRAVEIQPEYEDDEPHAKPAPGLAAAMAGLIKLTESHERVMRAAQVDIFRGDPAAAQHLLDEQLDGWDGPDWNGTDTGLEWLERTRKRAGEPS